MKNFQKSLVREERDLKMREFSRDLVFIRGERRSSGRATISVPVACAEEAGKAPCWYCIFTLSEISPVPGKAYGEDPLDAFLSAIRQIRSLIKAHAELGYRVWWNSEGDDGGFAL